MMKTYSTTAWSYEGIDLIISFAGQVENLYFFLQAQWVFAKKVIGCNECFHNLYCTAENSRAMKDKSRIYKQGGKFVFGEKWDMMNEITHYCVAILPDHLFFLSNYIKVHSPHGISIFCQADGVWHFLICFHVFQDHENKFKYIIETLD